jgi:hypothetical protein
MHEILSKVALAITLIVYIIPGLIAGFVWFVYMPYLVLFDKPKKRKKRV